MGHADFNSPYNFDPTTWVCVLYVVIFGLLVFGHSTVAIYHRMWWWIPTLITGAIGETIGWSGRLWSSKNPPAQNPFYMNICSLIISPSFMTAAMFIIFGRIINLVGPEYSIVRPKIYSIIFILADLAALVVQAIGGAKAAGAVTDTEARSGANIMVAGIIIQMAAVALYTIIAIEYLWRVHRRQPHRAPVAQQPTELATDVEKSAPASSLSLGLRGIDGNVKQMLIGLGIATFFLFIRSIFRTIELLGGWNGKVYSNETLFNVLDGMPIAAAMFTLLIFNPGRLIPTGKEARRAGAK